MLSKLKEYAKYVLLFTVAVLIYAFITNFNGTKSLFSSISGGVVFVLSRFVFGFGLAYILNFLVEWMCRKLRFPRWLGILVSYLALLGFITWMIIYIIPLVADSVTQILNLVQQVQPWMTGWLANFSPDDAVMIEEFVGMGITALTDVLKGLLSYSTVETVVRSSTRFVINTVFGLLISLYALIEKPNLLKHTRYITNALFPKQKATKILEFGRESNKVFSQYLVGKTLDSLIIGVMSYVIYLIVQIPMPAFMALVSGVTNMIPYFGPVIGGVITVTILVCFDPMMALYALIIVVVVQTLDGMVIGPRILGNAVGISPLLTVVAILIGGDVGGLLGIFLGIPILAVMKTMLYDKWIVRKLAEREGEAGGKEEQDSGGEPQSSA